ARARIIRTSASMSTVARYASCSTRSSASRARSASVACSAISFARAAGRSSASDRSSSTSVNRRSLAIAPAPPRRELGLGEAEPRGALAHVIFESAEDLADGPPRQIERGGDPVLRVAVEVMHDRHGQLLLRQPLREQREIVQVLDPAGLVAE